MNDLITMTNVCKKYDGFTLGPIDLRVPGGTILGLIGENGAGKTTLIKTMMDIVHPDSGEIRILGKDAQDAKSEVGVVMDDLFFYEGLRVKDVDGILKSVFPTWDHALFLSYLERFSLDAKKKIRTLSRGMRMKMSLAAALSHHPKLLLLDEATAGLDPVVRDEILDIFLDFISDEEHAILMSSHITSDLEKAADYIAYLHNGQIVLCDEKDRILEDYGRAVCGAKEMERIDPSYLVGMRKTQFSTEVLIRNRGEFVKEYPNCAVERVTLEDIMVMLNREGSK